MSNCHDVFVSFHHKDEDYKIEFERLISKVGGNLKLKAVQDKDIDPDIPVATIR